MGDSNQTWETYQRQAERRCQDTASRYRLLDVPEGESDSEAVQRLAALSSLDYDRIRDQEAERLKVRAATLDKEVAKARAELHGQAEGAAEAKGRKIELYQPEPWPDPVDGAAVLDEAFSAILRHMAIRQEHAVTTALWAAHTHAFDAFSHTPRLAITAPDAECGKTVLLNHLVGSLVTRPQPVELMKAAPFFRLIEEFRPVFLIDEVDVFLKEDSDLPAAINGGWEPHGGVVRCVGPDFEVRHFSTYCPVAMGGIKLHKVLPATTLSRSFAITLERATLGEIAEPWDTRRHKPKLLEIGQKLARWVADHREKLRLADPELPGGVFNRRADKWRPLFAIAQLAGGDWPEQVKQAFLVEEQDSRGSKLSPTLQLLSDIREVLKDHEHAIATTELIDRLCALDESPWSEYNFRERDEERRKIQSRQISGLLKDYRIKPNDMRLGAWHGKGYRRGDLETAWKRYLPPNLSATTQQSRGF